MTAISATTINTTTKAKSISETFSRNAEEDVELN